MTWQGSTRNYTEVKVEIYATDLLDDEIQAGIKPITLQDLKDAIAFMERSGVGGLAGLNIYQRNGVTVIATTE